MPASFSNTYTQFLNELKDTLPEFLPALVAASELPDAQAQFTALWRPYTADAAAKNSAIFTVAGIGLVPGVTMTASLWSELSPATQNAIWKYISSLLLLAATDDDSLWDLSGFKTSLSTMMAHMTRGGAEGADLSGALPEGFASLFEKLSSMGAGFPDLSGVLPGNFKIPERLFKGHIAKIAEELVLGGTHTQRVIGLINDDSTEVGSVHLGVVHLFELSSDDVKSNEDAIQDLRFETLEDLHESRDRLETWSQICIDHLWLARQ
jgi:hypothetical protein